MAGMLTTAFDVPFPTVVAPGGVEIECDAQLVESAVFASVRGTPLEPVYQKERESCYGVPDPEARELAFSRLHHAWFAQLNLAQPVFDALREQPGVLKRTARCILAPGIRRQDEYAELFGNTGGADAKPCLVIRLTPESFRKPELVLQRLRHELMHIADMLHPAFAYDPSLAQFHDDNGVPTVIRDRYRVLWDTYIDGRLCRAGSTSPDVRARRLAEFSSVFKTLGARTGAAFGAIFDTDTLNHPDLLRFARNPESFA